MFINGTAVFVCGLQIRQYHSVWLWSLHIKISLMTRTFCNSQSPLSLSCHLEYALTNTSELFMHFDTHLYFCTVEALYNSVQFPIVEVNYCLNCCWGSCTDVNFDCQNATVAGSLQICTPCLLAFTPIIYTGSSISESDDFGSVTEHGLQCSVVKVFMFYGMNVEPIEVTTTDSCEPLTSKWKQPPVLILPLNIWVNWGSKSCLSQRSCSHAACIGE